MNHNDKMRNSKWHFHTVSHSNISPFLLRLYSYTKYCIGCNQWISWIL